jgi:hypothetical protein
MPKEFNLVKTLLELGVSIKANTDRRALIKEVPIEEKDFTQDGQFFKAPPAYRENTFDAMKVYLESYTRYRFLYELQNVVLHVARSNTNRETYEHYLRELLPFQEVLRYEADTFLKARDVCKHSALEDYFNAVRNGSQNFFTELVSQTTCRGNVDTMIARFVKNSKVFSLNGIVGRLMNYEKDPYEVLPLGYDPIGDASDTRKEFSHKKIKNLILDNTYVRCAASGKLVPVEHAAGTVYGSYIDHAFWLTAIRNGDETWTRCPGTAGNNFCLLADSIRVINRSNKTEGWYYKGYVALHPKKFFQKDGVTYNFDPEKYPCNVMGRGWFTEAEAKRYGVFEPTLNAYIADHNNFNMFPHDADVLNYFPGFKHLRDEEVTRGSPEYTKNTLFMGLELEVEMRKDAQLNKHQGARTALVAMKGDAITVHDGSLENGFEIVSIPATINYHSSMWKEFLRSPVRNHLVSYKKKTCGIHVHMSKEAFSPLALGKFMTFINHPKNAEFINAVAQRGSNKYNVREETKVSRGKNRKTFTTKDGHPYRDHYAAVNLLSPHTVEVRIFKGTLHYPSVMKNLQFCHALHGWVSSLTGGVNDVGDYNKFCEYISLNRKIYEFLYDFLKLHSGGWIKDRYRCVAETSSRDISDEQAVAPIGAADEELKTPIPPDRLRILRQAGLGSKRFKLT